MRKKINQYRKMSEEVKDPAERLDMLVKQLEENGYNKQGYRDGTSVTLEGELFQKFVMHNANVNRVLDTYEQHFDNLMDVSKGLAILTKNALDEIAKMSILLMEQHIKNVEAGITVSHEVLDLDDAEKSIVVEDEK